MAVLPFSYFPPRQAQALVRVQRKYTPEQALAAQTHPHLVWVTPRTRTLPNALRLRVFAEEGGVCAYCGKRLTKRDFTVDHIVAVANGGTDDRANLTLACRPCNSAKGAR